MCTECSPLAEQPIIPLQVCIDCELQGSSHRHIVHDPSHTAERRGLTAAVQHLEHCLLRPSSQAGVIRGVQDFENFAEHMGELGLPADPVVVCLWLVYCITIRQPEVLDASTIMSYANACRVWHDLVRNVTGLPLKNPFRDPRVRRLMKHLKAHFKKESKAKRPFTLMEAKRMYSTGFRTHTRSGRHHLVTFMFSNLGLLRKNASRQLRCTYRVRSNGRVTYPADSQVRVVRPPPPEPSYIHVRVGGRHSSDKNATAAKPGDRFIPAIVHQLEVHPVELFEAYLVLERPPSGGLLLAAPLGKTGFRDTPFTNHGEAFVKAYERSHPEADDSKLVGSGSARKALAQWLWSGGWAKRVIADAGGWFCKKSAVDLYFKTDPDRILDAIENVGQKTRLPQNRR